MAAKVADALDHIDWVMPMGSVQDVPSQAAELYEFVATVSNTTKPIVFLSYSPEGMEIVFDMAAEIGAALRDCLDVLARKLVPGKAAIHLEGAHRGDDHRRGDRNRKRQEG